MNKEKNIKKLLRVKFLLEQAIIYCNDQIHICSNLISSELQNEFQKTETEIIEMFISDAKKEIGIK